MGPKLLIFNRISRHVAWAVLSIPRIGRKAHKSNCFVGISTTLPSPWGQSLFLRSQCVQTFSFWLHLPGPWENWRDGAGAVRTGEVQQAATCPGGCSHQVGAPGVCSEESSWSSGPNRNVYQHIRDSGQPLLQSVITGSWPKYLSLNFPGIGTWTLLLKTRDSITPNSAGLHE